MADTRIPASDDPADWPAEHVTELKWLFTEAAVTTDWLGRNPRMFEAFVRWLNLRLADGGVEGAYDAGQVWRKLERLRRGSELPKVRVHAVEDARTPIRPAMETDDAGATTAGKPQTAQLFER